MIELNGKKFARNDKEFTNSLFAKGGTCVGYYRPYKKSIALMDQHKNRIGVITANRVLACATKQENGKYWYSYADIDLIGRYESYAEQSKDILAALKSTGLL